MPCSAGVGWGDCALAVVVGLHRNQDALAKLALSSEFVRTIEAEKPASARLNSGVCRSSMRAVRKWPVLSLVIGTIEVPDCPHCIWMSAQPHNLQTTNSSVLL